MTPEHKKFETIAQIAKERDSAKAAVLSLIGIIELIVPRVNDDLVTALVTSELNRIKESMKK